MFLNRLIRLRLQDVITYVELPMNDDEGVRLTTWPIALPHHMAYQLLKAGFREHLGEANDFYWQTMSDEFGVQKPQFQDSIGIQLYGDECQFFENEQWMCFHWMSDNSIWWKDGRKSRFLICMIPVSKYAVHNGVNLTLQSVLSAVAVSLNFWRSNSVRDVGAQLVGLKGDWKFLTQSLNLMRHPNCEAFCFLCEGSKGMERPITDLSVSAGWRCDVARPPWNSEPSLMQVEGFSLALVGLDLLHIWYLGCGRDLIASVLVILIRTGFFPGNNVLSSVHHPNLYCHMYSFCAHVGFVVSIEFPKISISSYTTGQRSNGSGQSCNSCVVKIAWSQATSPMAPHESQAMFEKQQFCTSYWKGLAYQHHFAFLSALLG